MRKACIQYILQLGHLLQFNLFLIFDVIPYLFITRSFVSHFAYKKDQNRGKTCDINNPEQANTKKGILCLNQILHDEGINLIVGKTTEERKIQHLQNKKTIRKKSAKFSMEPQKHNLVISICGLATSWRQLTKMPRCWNLKY